MRLLWYYHTHQEGRPTIAAPDLAMCGDFNHRISVIELTEAQTIALVERCRQEGVTVNTVKVHSRNVYGKLGVHNRTEAASKAQALGILPST